MPDKRLTKARQVNCVHKFIKNNNYWGCIKCKLVLDKISVNEVTSAQRSDHIVQEEK